MVCFGRLAVSSSDDVHADNRPEERETCLRHLLARGVTGAALNLQTPDSRETALHFASAAGWEGVVRLILQQPGINPGLRCGQGKLPLEVATTDAVKAVFAEALLPASRGKSGKGKGRGFTAEVGRLCEELAAKDAEVCRLMSAVGALQTQLCMQRSLGSAVCRREADVWERTHRLCVAGLKFGWDGVDLPERLSQRASVLQGSDVAGDERTSALSGGSAWRVHTDVKYCGSAPPGIRVWMDGRLQPELFQRDPCLA